MILVGGVTRLTDSGLSITEWKPIMGAIPPLSEADWQHAFEAYRQIPEYAQVNPTMDLAAFKTIYWWEWTHRFLGRLIGAAFLVPFLFFWWAGYISRALWPKLAGLFALGGLQGAVGWYMVKSGLVDRIDVSQYRLAVHFGIAVLILGATLWLWLGLGAEPKRKSPRPHHALGVAALVLVLVYLQMLAGALVAGLDAGFGFNTWPLINGAFVPDGLGGSDAMVPEPVRKSAHRSVRPSHAGLCRACRDLGASRLACAQARCADARLQRHGRGLCRSIAGNARGLDAASCRADRAWSRPSGRRHRALHRLSTPSLARQRDVAQASDSSERLIEIGNQIGHVFEPD